MIDGANFRVPVAVLDMHATVISPEEYVQTRWKNGLGMTTQIVISPPTATVSTAFDYRISSAGLVPGDFSSFPGYDRLIMMLPAPPGAPSAPAPAVRILSSDHKSSSSSITLNQLEPIAFSGDAKTSASFVDVVASTAVVPDFNVIVNRNKYFASTRAISLAANESALVSTDSEFASRVATPVYFANVVLVSKPLSLFSLPGSTHFVYHVPAGGSGGAGAGGDRDAHQVQVVATLVSPSVTATPSSTSSTTASSSSSSSSSASSSSSDSDSDSTLPSSPCSIVIPSGATLELSPAATTHHEQLPHNVDLVLSLMLDPSRRAPHSGSAAAGESAHAQATTAGKRSGAVHLVVVSVHPRAAGPAGAGAGPRSRL